MTFRGTFHAQGDGTLLRLLNCWLHPSGPWADKISPELMALFAESNARLAASTGLDLRGFGYPMPD